MDVEENSKDDIDSDADKVGEVIVRDLKVIEDSKYGGVKDNKPGDYTVDMGIYCDCDDYKVNPVESSSASFNLLAGLFMISFIFYLVRKEGDK